MLNYIINYYVYLLYMPEGPEILYTVLLLKKVLKEYKFIGINSYTAKPAIIPHDLTDTIEEIDCYGKLFWIKIKGKNQSYYLDIHYGISGWLIFGENNKPEKNIKFDFKFKKNDNELIIYMEDRRRFSKVQFHTEEEHNKLINKLGVDILSKDFTYDYFEKIIQSKKTILAAILLKQEFFAGLGNYIKNEVIFLSNVDIQIKTNELKEENIKKIYDNILFVSYSNLIELLQNEKLEKLLDIKRKTNMPKQLEVPYTYKIYGQDKTSSGKKVFKTKVAGRDSYYIK
jgi:formamidopyrimidine-DNA glycosylase